jgi:hypothetical protein
MIDVFKFIYDRVGNIGNRLMEEIKQIAEPMIRAVTGDEVELIKNCHGMERYMLPDKPEIRFWLEQAIIEGVIKTSRIDPIWNSYEAKLKILKPLKIKSTEKAALKKACLEQSMPYRNRALKWLVHDSHSLPSFKSQVIQWLEDEAAGKKVREAPLSEKQFKVLLEKCFNSNSDRPSDWLPSEPTEMVEAKQLDPWTGDYTTVMVPKEQHELDAKRLEYYRRVRP